MDKLIRTKKSYLVIIIIAFLCPIIIAILDFVDITHIVPLTAKYDWLGFIGAYISGICTLWLGLISIKQNDTLEKVNKKMLNNDMISNCFSQIDVEKVNYIDNNYKKQVDYFGIQMINSSSMEDEQLCYFRIILQVKDKNQLPLVSAQINQLEIQYKSNNQLTYFDQSYTYNAEKTNETKLEVTPNNETISYYLPIYIADNEKVLQEIDQCGRLRIIAQIDVKNSFDVISSGEYTVIIDKKSRVHNSDWTEYSLFGRKIYYKNVMYKEGNT